MSEGGATVKLDPVHSQNLSCRQCYRPPYVTKIGVARKINPMKVNGRRKTLSRHTHPAPANVSSPNSAEYPN